MIRTLTIAIFVIAVIAMMTAGQVYMQRKIILLELVVTSGLIIIYVMILGRASTLKAVKTKAEI